MTLEELQQSVDKDFKLDDTELDAESIKIPLLHNKYLQHFNKFSLLLRKAEYDHKSLVREKWEYYTGKAPAEIYAEKPFDLKILRTDIDKYLESDTELQKAKQKVDYLEATVDFLDRTIRQIANRGFTIKNAIDWRKFTSGAI